MLGIAASVFSIAGHYTGAGMVMKNGKPDHTAYYSYSPCIAFYKDHIRNIKKEEYKKPREDHAFLSEKADIHGFSSFYSLFVIFGRIFRNR